MKTYEELERLAYIEGKVEQAALCAELDDALLQQESHDEELIVVKNQLDDAEGSLMKLEEVMDGVRETLDELQRDLRNV